MAIQQGNTTEWTKSTYSANGACVEVKSPTRCAVAVRDSKVPHGPSLSFPPGAWAGFVAGLSGGEGAGTA
ncbi:toxin [Streptomyces nanshensis]|nr:toxin [Streptomyces nanshensis]